LKGRGFSRTVIDDKENATLVAREYFPASITSHWMWPTGERFADALTKRKVRCEFATVQCCAGTPDGTLTLLVGVWQEGSRKRDIAGCHGMPPLSAPLCCHWRHSRRTINPAARCNPILPFNSKRSRLPNPEVRAGMATPVRATGSTVRFARDTGVDEIPASFGCVLSHFSMNFWTRSATINPLRLFR
jgi:hypothetical protein